MILDFEGKHPKIDPTAYIAENATVIGDVEVGPESSIWFQSVVRGDVHAIRIGANCNIQDACVLHVEMHLHPLILEDEVVLGHRVTLHGCRIRRGALIGIGAIILNGAEVGEDSIVGAGSVVTPNTILPPRMLSLGTPAKPIRPLNEKDFESIRDVLEHYRYLKGVYSSAGNR
jgi:carbonic anhydrase/acetyltransferase-like protein (isoleucine patch superfamily)